jgi:hypothetical protein
MLHGSTREATPDFERANACEKARRIFFSNLLHRGRSDLNMRPRYEVWYRS